MMRIIGKSEEDYVVFETENVTFNKDGFVYCRVPYVAGGIVRFQLKEDDNAAFMRFNLAKDNYLDLSTNELQYYVEKPAEAPEEVAEEPEQVEGEVVTEQ